MCGLWLEVVAFVIRPPCAAVLVGEGAEGPAPHYHITESGVDVCISPDEKKKKKCFKEKVRKTRPLEKNIQLLSYQHGHSFLLWRHLSAMYLPLFSKGSFASCSRSV